jgi:hypothetical protein
MRVMCTQSDLRTHFLTIIDCRTRSMESIKKENVINPFVFGDVCLQYNNDKETVYVFLRTVVNWLSERAFTYVKQLQL